MSAKHTPGLFVGINPKYHRVLALVAAAESAEQWLCETLKGTDQHERGIALRDALADFKAGPSHAEAVRAVSSHASHLRQIEKLREALKAMVMSFPPERSEADEKRIFAALAALKESATE